MTIKHLGEFTVESGTIRISDPCYTKDTWCAGTVKAKNGVWEGEVILSDEGNWGMRVAHLRARLKNAGGAVFDTSRELDIDVGVDSGQAGIFDDAKYPDGERTGEYGDLSTFYGKACAQTLDDETGNRAMVVSSTVSESSPAPATGTEATRPTRPSTATKRSPSTSSSSVTERTTRTTRKTRKTRNDPTALRRAEFVRAVGSLLPGRISILRTVLRQSRRGDSCHESLAQVGERTTMKNFFVEKAPDSTFFIVDEKGVLVDDEKYSSWETADTVRRKYVDFVTKNSHRFTSGSSSSNSTHPEFLSPNFGPGS